MQVQVDALYRYPVKGLSPEPLAHVDLVAGSFVPGDRLYAVENGPSGFDRADPQWQPKTKFLMLQRDEALARLRTRYDDATRTLHIAEGGREVARGNLSTAEGRAAVETFLEGYVPRSMRGPARVIEAPSGFRFTDSTKGFVSVINLASVQALEDMVGAPVDPLRLRGNVHITGLAPWQELDLVGATLEAPDGLKLTIIKRIQRCAAVNVDPTTGMRDMQIPTLLSRRFGHLDCGVYARVTRGGRLATGTTLTLTSDVHGEEPAAITAPER